MGVFLLPVFPPFPIPDCLSTVFLSISLILRIAGNCIGCPYDKPVTKLISVGLVLVGKKRTIGIMESCITSILIISSRRRKEKTLLCEAKRASEREREGFSSP